MLKVGSLENQELSEREGLGFLYPQDLLHTSDMIIVFFFKYSSIFTQRNNDDSNKKT